MPAEISGSENSFDRALRELAELRQYQGPAKEFWPRLVTCLGSLTTASRVFLLLKDPNQGIWKKIGEWSAHVGSSRVITAFVAKLEPAANHYAEGGTGILPLDEGNTRIPNHYVIGTRLKLQRLEDICVAVLLLSEVNEATGRELLLRLKLASDTPSCFQQTMLSQQAKADVENFAIAMDMMVLVNAEKQFLSAALAFCNSLATGLKCERVSLGWLEGGYVKLRAVSRTEHFERRMAAAQKLEAAMEECMDQDEELLWPAPEGSILVVRDHEKYGQDQECGNLCSLPLRLDGKGVGVVTCERRDLVFTPLEVNRLRLCCDQASRRLSDLKHHDRWFGARWATSTRELLAKVLGPEHTWKKVLAITVVLLLAFLFFFPVTYRVEGNFILRSDEVSYLTAPFDGYIHQVFVRAGDVLPKGGKLVSLNTSELELELSSALADLHRYEREAEKARATKALAEMRIAQAMAEQAQAKVDLLNYRLEQSALKAPFDSIVVEGDLREKLGAPVKQGDALYKVARTDSLYVEAEVNERDIHEILGKGSGEIAFVSQPKLKFPIKVMTVEPAAMPKTDGNVFLVRCAFADKPQKWWRPGMSGLCKLNVEKRTLAWILTHRTVDFLRMKLWW